MSPKSESMRGTKTQRFFQQTQNSGFGVNDDKNSSNQSSDQHYFMKSLKKFMKQQDVSLQPKKLLLTTQYNEPYNQYQFQSEKKDQDLSIKKTKKISHKSFTKLEELGSASKLSPRLKFHKQVSSKGKMYQV